MIITESAEFRDICKQISEQHRSLTEWALVESDDMFQSERFQGGFDTTENEFVFSYLDDKEYWFQLSLLQVEKISNGEKINLVARPAEQ